jgi:NTP pyrophosphatase (non-canonical NTP hydrolase)
MKVRRGFVSNSSSSSFSADSTSDERDLLDDVDYQIHLLRERGYGNRERLFRKLIEEAGEYGEAIEYDNGSTRKKAKFKGEDPKEKLKEEVVDIVMVGLALASIEELCVEDVLDILIDKLALRQKEYEESLKEE